MTNEKKDYFTSSLDLLLVQICSSEYVNGLSSLCISLDLGYAFLFLWRPTYGCWVILVASGNVTESGRLFYTIYYTHCWELMKSVGSHCSLSLLVVMKVMVWHFVSNSHKVMTASLSC